jgi:hypothetical protein
MLWFWHGSEFNLKYSILSWHFMLPIICTLAASDTNHFVELFLLCKKCWCVCVYV